METKEVQLDDAVERVISTLRERLTTALNNGQRVHMDAKEGTTKPRLTWSQFERGATFPMPELDGSYELHVFISAKPGLTKR